MSELPKFPKNENYPTLQWYINKLEQWREEFVAKLEIELANTKRRFPRWEGELQKFQEKVLGAFK